MAHRKENIGFQMKRKLQSMDVSSKPDQRNKHADKIATRKARGIAKKEGKSHEEIRKIDFSKNKIYSFDSMKTYIREAEKYANWLAERGMKKATMNQAKAHVQAYIDDLTSKGYAASTVHTALSACCKIFGTYHWEYDKPKVRVSEYKRGRSVVNNDQYNEKNHSEILQANRLIGVRKSELASIRRENVDFLDDRVIIHTIGKGGKRNVQVFFDEKEREQIAKMCEGKKPHEYLFNRREIMKGDCDLHSERANRAKDVYRNVVRDMQENPERWEFYRNYIEEQFVMNGSNPPKDLDKPYICRGKFRQKLIAEGKPYVYDRLAVMFVSLTVLNHWRVDTSVQHYIGK